MLNQNRMRSAFTMMELILVIVIIGILASIAVPRLAATRDDATFVRAKSQVAAIRSGIALQKSQRMLQGQAPFPATLDNAGAGAAVGTPLFFFSDGNASNALESPVLVSNGGWTKTGANTYNINVGAGVNVPFTYNPNTGLFSCTIADSNCQKLIN